MSLADVVRLFAVPIFGLIAYRDVKFRRVPDRVWYPLIGLGLLTIGYELFQVRDAPASLQRVVFVEAGIGIGFLLLVAVVLYVLDLADVSLARALAVIGLVYPRVPSDPLFGLDLPLVRPGHGLLSFTILTNAALIGLLYPIGYVLWNTVHGRFAPVMFAGRPVVRERVIDRHGRLLQTSNGFTLRGIDLEAIKAYLRWREITVPLIAQQSQALRDPNYGSDPMTAGDVDTPEFVTDPNDPWGAERFLDEGEYIGELTAEELRGSLELLAENEHIWVSANFPFAVPIFAGLLIALSVGDIATGFLRLIG